MRLTSIMYSLENSAELLSLIKLGVDILHLDLEKIPKATALDLISVIRDLECKSKGRPIAIALELRTRAPTTGLTEVDILIVPEATPSKVQTIRDNARERRVPMIFARISLIQNFKDFKRILKVVDGVVLSPEPMLPELAAANILIYMNTIVESCKKYCRNTIFVAHNNSGVYNAAGSASCVSSLYGALGCGVDCVSISPNAIVEVEATIKFLCSVCRIAEINHNITSHYLFGTIVGYKPSTTALAECARLLAYCTNSSCVLQLSNCVPTAKALSAARLHCPVVVPVTNKKESNYDRHLIKFASLAGLLTLNRLFLILCEADSKDTVNQLSVMKYDSEVIEMLKTSH